MLSSHVKFNIISVSFIFRKVKYDLTGQKPYFFLQIGNFSSNYDKHLVENCRVRFFIFLHLSGQDISC
jgi:hypothetical protein